MNSSGALDTSGALVNGTSNNVRWAIQNASTSSGTFTLLVRQGNDTTNSQIVLEATDTLTVQSDTNNSIDVALTILEMT